MMLLIAVLIKYDLIKVEQIWDSFNEPKKDNKLLVEAKIHTYHEKFKAVLSKDFSYTECKILDPDLKE